MLTQPLPGGDDTVRTRSSLLGNCQVIASRLLPYGAAIVLSCILLVVVLQLWKANLHVPLDDRSDAIWNTSWIKCTQENGWFLLNPLLGGPEGSELYDFPMSENLHLLVIKLLGYIFRPTGLLFNVYVLLMYPLTACTALFVLRRLSIPTGLALVGSLLFAFLPYHLLRGHPHIFLASYYLVPLQIWMCLVLMRGESPDETPDSTTPRPISRKSVLGMLFLSLLVSAGGVYYAFFGCFFLLLAGLYAVIQWGSWRNLAIACLLCAWTSVLMVANLAPSIIYHRTHGNNVDAVRRSHFEAEMFGLKVAQLLLPITNHRIPLLAALKDRYRYKGVMMNENDASSLGLIASVGFLILLAQFLRWGKRADGERPGLLPTMAILNGGAVLLATIGGFGSLFSLVITPWIRGYNRISIYIGFWSIAAVLFLLQPVLTRVWRSHKRIWLYPVGLAMLLAIGIYDQTSPCMQPEYAQVNTRFAHLKNFVARIEASVPKGAMVFQLPYVKFPEGESYGWSGGYDNLLPTLFSSSLHWSFGVVQGREGDSQMFMLATLPPASMLEKMVQVGYEGLLIDCQAYPDLGHKMDETFTRLIGGVPQYSDDRRWMFFSLGEVKHRLRDACSSEEWERTCQELAHPVVPLFGKGFYNYTGTVESLWRWCLSVGEVFLSNTGDSAREVEIDFVAERFFAYANLHVQCGTTTLDLPIGPKAQRGRLKLTVPPGKTKVTFTCQGPDYVENHADPRQIENGLLSYRMVNFQVYDVHTKREQPIAVSHASSSRK